jgi:hypothetical protein
MKRQSLNSHRGELWKRIKNSAEWPLQWTCASSSLRLKEFTALAVIERMVGHLPDLHRIWVGTSDHQLATLCNDFPGFSRYASLMEEAADAERRKASRPYDVPGI